MILGGHMLGERMWEAVGYLEAGGPIMLPLLAVSVWLWMLILIKAWELIRYRRAERPSRGLGAGQGWQAAILADFRSQKTHAPEDDARLLKRLILRQAAHLDRHVGTILVLASLAPLIGLLGTVSGMITTFEVISLFGTGNASALAGGISEALITTQTGLVVALPGLVAGNFIRRRVERLKARMERFRLGLIEAPSALAPAGGV